MKNIVLLMIFEISLFLLAPLKFLTLSLHDPLSRHIVCQLWRLVTQEQGRIRSPAQNR